MTRHVTHTITIKSDSTTEERNEESAPLRTREMKRNVRLLSQHNHFPLQAIWKSQVPSREAVGCGYQFYYQVFVPTQPVLEIYNLPIKKPDILPLCYLVVRRINVDI